MSGASEMGASPPPRATLDTVEGGEARPRRRYAAEVVLIVPVYGHSILVTDALDSVLAQPDQPSVLGVIVNDGCQFPETHATCLEYATAHPDRLVYLQQANQGLSAARNTGIEWSLKNVDGFEAIYLLDADNILIEGSIAQALDTMRASGSDWVYPPYHGIGVYAVQEQVTPFSPNKLTRFNYIDAGCLVHRRVLDAGLRFDRKMNKGYEDWDFWLAAASQGFRGVYDRDLGLLYRKRPESMLSDSDLMKGDLVSAIQSKHKVVMQPVSQAELAANERPRYAVILSSSRKVVATSFIGDDGVVISKADLERSLWRVIGSGVDHDVPSFFVWVDDAVWDHLKRLKILPWLLVDAVRALRTQSIYGVCLTPVTETGELSVSWSRGSVRSAAMLVLASETVQSVCRDSSTRWLEDSLLAVETAKHVKLREVRIPAEDKDADRRAVFAVIDNLTSFQRSPFRSSAGTAWQWKPKVWVPPLERYSVFQEPYLAAAPLPWRASGRDVVLAMTFAEFGGADRVGYNVARAMRERGWTPHLVVTGDQLRVRLPQDFLDTFETISFLDSDEPVNWSGGGFYCGTGLTSWGKSGNWIRLWELVWFCKVFINNHSVAANAVVGRLKQSGIVSFSYQHLAESDVFGHRSGHPMLALAYESSYAGILGCSEAICDWMVSEGVPREKVRHIRNGPGFIIAPETAEQVARTRTQVGSRNLRVLYLGRLDRQKGVSSLMEVHRQSESEGLPIDWRIVGGGMVDGEAAVMRKEFGSVIEPPIYDGRDVLSVLGWADVILLLSDYEGLPLVLVEAMLCGVVPISTDVGAISELITDGRNGYLVAPETREMATLARLRELCGDRGRLEQLSRAAHEEGRLRNDWAGAVEPLLAIFEAAEARRAKVAASPPR